MKHNLLIEVDCGDTECGECLCLNDMGYECQCRATGALLGVTPVSAGYIRDPACLAVEAAAKAPDLEPWRELAREIVRADRRAGDDVVAGGELEALANAARRLLGEP